jgi:hypothetical protein
MSFLSSQNVMLCKNDTAFTMHYFCENLTEMFVKFSENWPIFPWFSHFHENWNMHFCFTLIGQSLKKSQWRNARMHPKHSWPKLSTKTEHLNNSTWILQNGFSTYGFFHQTNPPRPLIHGLKPFWIWLWIREENGQSWLHSGVNDTDVHII